MARIQRLQASVGLQPAAGSPGTLRDPRGDALANVGAQVKGFGLAVLERQQRREAFEDDHNFRMMEAQLDTALFERQQQIEPGGAGFTDGFLTEDFDRITNDYLSTIEDPDIRAERAAAIELAREQRGLRAAGIERDEVIRFQTGEMSGAAEAAMTRIATDPDSYEAEVSLLNGMLDSSNLSPAERYRLQGVLAQGLGTAFLDALVETDPLRALIETGGSIDDLPEGTQASIMVGSMIDADVTPPNRGGERVGPHGMTRAGLLAILQREGTDVDRILEQPGGLEALLSNPDTARVYADAYMEYLLTDAGFENPQDAIVAFYMGEDYARGDWESRRLPRAVQTAMNSTIETITGDRGRPATITAPSTYTPPAHADPGHVAAARAAATREGIPVDLFMRLVQQESSWNPDIVSHAGAVGLGQLMPGTARELGVADSRDPIANLQGAARYLREQYDRFGSWDIALAAYNAGPGAVAEHGGIPPYAETQNYVETIYGDGSVVATGGGGAGRIPLTRGDGAPLPATEYDEIDPRLVTAAQDVFARYGFTELPILDAERAEGAGYGATSSQHILHHADGTPTGRSGALDISVAQLSIEDRVRLIEDLSAAGVTGIGVYRGNYIHIDLGPRRAWGNRDAGGGWGDIPDWARDVLNRHSTGQIDGATLPPRGAGAAAVAAGYGATTAAREAALGALTTGTQPVAVRREQAQTFLDDTLAAYADGVPMPPRSAIASRLAELTPSQQSTYQDRFYVAESVQAITEGLPGMERGAMEQLLNRLGAPDSPYRGTAVGREVRDEVQAAVDAEVQLRSSQPATAAIRDPAVAERWAAITADPETGLPADPGAIQDYITENRRVQMTQYGLSPGEVEYLPPMVIAAIADRVDDVTRNPDMTREQRTAAMSIMTIEMYNMYGEFADEVLVNVIDFMNNGPLEDTPEAALFRSLRTLERDPNDPRMAPLDGGQPFIDGAAPPDPPGGETEDQGADVTPQGGYDTSTPEEAEASARRAAIEAQGISSGRQRDRFIRSLPEEVRDRVRELLQ